MRSIVENRGTSEKGKEVGKLAGVGLVGVGGVPEKVVKRRKGMESYKEK